MEQKIGKLLQEISEASYEERGQKEKNVLELIKGHREEKVIELLIKAAKLGEREALLGSCLPPDLSKEGIVFFPRGVKVYARW